MAFCCIFQIGHLVSSVSMSKLVLIGDSRVRALSYSESNIFCVCDFTPGATTYDLYNNVERVCSNNRDVKYIYIASGICGLTSRLKGSSGEKYEEVIVQDLSTKLDTEKEAVENLQNFILRHDALPVFCTCYPLSLEDWNMNRMSKSKTIALKHQQDYGYMQQQLHDIIKEFNSHIVETNGILKLTTPLIHTTLIHNRGNSKNSTFKYNWLYDGCHPNEKMANKMMDTIAKAHRRNTLAC